MVKSHKFIGMSDELSELLRIVPLRSVAQAQHWQRPGIVTVGGCDGQQAPYGVSNCLAMATNSWQSHASCLTNAWTGDSDKAVSTDS